MNKKEVLSYHIYMWNTFNKNECATIFNRKDQDWQYSQGEHIWKMFEGFCEKKGRMCAPSMMVSELDENSLQKIIDRACELYVGRKNKQ